MGRCGTEACVIEANTAWCSGAVIAHLHESSPFTRKCQQAKPPVNTRPSRRGGREVRASARESDQLIHPGRCPARMRSIDRHSLPTKVLENLLDHRRFLEFDFFEQKETNTENLCNG